MIRIAFGPMVHLPSTEWVGRDVAEYIKATQDEVNVDFFDNFEKILDVDVIFIIKLMPSFKWLLRIKLKGIRVIYTPVDYFHHPALFEKEKAKLELFDFILLHNQRLLSFFPSSVKNVEFIDHYLKYQLPTTKKFEDDGFLLWVGHIEYIPSLLKALPKHSLGYPLRVLTDLENLWGETNLLKNKLLEAGLPFSLELCENHMVLNGIKLEQWTAKKQEKYMLTCKAAFDTKNDSFAHNLKPPTKAQKYIFNGIPFAISEHSYAYDYFLHRGLKLATLETPKRWLSIDYFNEVNDFKNKYAHTQTLDYVSKQYLTVAKNALKMLPQRRLSIFRQIYLAVLVCKSNAFYTVRRVVEKINK